MKSTKGLVLLLILLAGGLFVAFAKTNGNGSDNPKQKLLTTVGELLEKQHYSPQNIDDAFSKKIFDKMLDEMDADRCLFIGTDITALKPYETKLDDEIHGKDDIGFLPALNTIYDKRTEEVIALYKQILSSPFDFNADETFVADGDKLDYSKDEATRRERLRKKLKYMTLDRFVDLIDQRDKSTVDSIKQKNNAQLETEARARVQKAMDKIYSRIKAKFTADERFNVYVNLIANLMDPHTDYFPPVEKRAFDEQMSGRFFGIGAQLQEQDGNIKIAMLMPAYPAQRSGEIAVNDVILKVAQGNGEPVEITGYSIEDAVKLIRGKRDTEVKLTLKKTDGTTKVVTLTRAEIVQDEVYVRSSVATDENGDKIGYIYLPDFYADFERADGARCSVDVAKEIIKLKAANVKGIVMDLRYNGGGSLFEVIQMVRFFVPEGPVVQVREKDGRANPLEDKNGSVLYDGPLTVMVNETSASASEIFAAAIQDYHRGVIIGSATYGKGTVQRNVPLSRNYDFMFNNQQPDLGFVKLTFQKFYRVSGGSTQLKGVTPDVQVPDMIDYIKIRERDNKASLSWDEIKPANYKPIKEVYFTDEQIKKANDDITANSTFTLLKSNTLWLSKKNDEPKPLQLDKYRQYQKQIATTVEQNNNLIKSKNPLSMDVLREDYDKFYNNTDKAKGERYQAWLKAVKSDVYVAQAVSITKSMAEKRSTVLK